MISKLILISIQYWWGHRMLVSLKRGLRLFWEIKVSIDIGMAPSIYHWWRKIRIILNSLLTDKECYCILGFILRIRIIIQGQPYITVLPESIINLQTPLLSIAGLFPLQRLLRPVAMQETLAVVCQTSKIYGRKLLQAIQLSS